LFFFSVEVGLSIALYCTVLYKLGDAMHAMRVRKAWDGVGGWMREVERWILYWDWELEVEKEVEDGCGGAHDNVQQRGLEERRREAETWGLGERLYALRLLVVGEGLAYPQFSSFHSTARRGPVLYCT
jgi:hypothetical protein